MLNKKNILLVSFIGVTVALMSGYLAYGTPTSNCGDEMTLRCWGVFVAISLAIFIPITIFGLAMYWLKEGVFLLWKNFTLIYLFIYLFLIIINPWLPADYSPFEKNTVFMVLVPLYFLISLILILYKSIKLRGK